MGRTHMNQGLGSSFKSWLEEEFGFNRIEIPTPVAAPIWNSVLSNNVCRDLPSLINAVQSRPLFPHLRLFHRTSVAVVEVLPVSVARSLSLVGVFRRHHAVPDSKMASWLCCRPALTPSVALISHPNSRWWIVYGAWEREGSINNIRVLNL
ncbi:hypothetical protein AAHA92_00088 [Salvia divinorum]|uniref:Uncharacterized protein n=1 Tax=Salvia divinorum TaxID=28513 RepID=A0ABD1IKW5_SALDI